MDCYCVTVFTSSQLKAPGELKGWDRRLSTLSNFRDAEIVFCKIADCGGGRDAGHQNLSLI